MLRNSRLISFFSSLSLIERRAKKLAKLHFACQGRGEHCLYNRTFFTMKTRNPRIWIHLMFLALQVRNSYIPYAVVIGKEK
jgi:hypothetical protein